MKITTRITMSSLLMMFLVITVGTAGYYGMTVIYKKLEKMEGMSRELDAMSLLHVNLREAIAHLTNYHGTGNHEEREQFNKTSVKIEELFNALSVEKPDDSLKDAKSHYLDIKNMASRLFNIENPAGNKEAGRLIMNIHDAAERLIHTYIERDHLRYGEKMTVTMDEAVATRRLVNRIHVWGLVLSSLIGLLLIIYNTRSIVRPIDKITDSALRVSSGDWAYRFDIKGGGEEIEHLSIAVNRMRNTILGQVDELDRLFRGTITALAAAVDAKSPWTRGHSERVTSYSLAVGAELGLPETDLRTLELAALLHDIGKIGTYEAILDKAGKLTEEELKIIRQHPSKGAEILSPIKQLKGIVPLVKGHHESYDGSGYPDGLKGEKIPIMARILAVCDSYDAMAADRPYRKGRNKGESVAELKRCAGTQFDPEVVNTFVADKEFGDML